jgi:hypothetical protein
MAMIDSRAGRSATAPRRGERGEYIALLAVTYPFFLAAVLVNRLLPPRHRFFPTGASPRTGVFGEAWATARTSLPFAFMG